MGARVKGRLGVEVYNGILRKRDTFSEILIVPSYPVFNKCHPDADIKTMLGDLPV